MTAIITKSVVFGTILGATVSVAFSLLTASVRGRNVMTGEAMELKGIEAVCFQLAENGPASYLGSLFPLFLLSSILATAVVVMLLMWFGKAA